MAKVITLLAIVIILMMRPQGLFASKVRADVRCSDTTRIDP
jgi:branched-subunit amino acid ABC-type transport system permease component